MAEEENLESKITEEDKNNVQSDSTKGTVYTTGALIVGIAGVTIAAVQEHSFIGYALAGMIAASTIVLSGLLFSMGCYYFTPRSERNGYQRAHPWVPEKVVKYMQK